MSVLHGREGKMETPLKTEVCGSIPHTVHFHTTRSLCWPTGSTQTQVAASLESACRESLTVRELTLCPFSGVGRHTCSMFTYAQELQGANPPPPTPNKQNWRGAGFAPAA